MEDRFRRLVAAIREKNEGYSERETESHLITSGTQPTPDDQKGG